MRGRRFFRLIAAALILALSSCVATRREAIVSRTLYDRGVASADQLAEFFMRRNPAADRRQVRRLSALYVQEAAYEGINSDCAFVQMCLETGFLKFGGLVTPDMHNYCGLGAIDAEHRGERFRTEREGVRAHIQHLHAYATSGIGLRNKCIDRRYKYVTPRGKARTIEGLSGTWAADRNYGAKLEALLEELEGML